MTCEREGRQAGQCLEDVSICQWLQTFATEEYQDVV
jgi:hypothetical protein